MLKRILTIILSTALILSMFAGCVKVQNSNPPPVNKQNDDDVTKTSNSNTPTVPDAKNYGDTGGLVLPIVDKPITLSYMVTANITDANEKPIIKELEKRTGIKLDIIGIPAASYAEKLKITMASGKLPDIFHGATSSEQKQLGAQGILTPVNKHIDKLPNFKKLYVEENPWVLKSWSDDNGDIYTWPVYGVSRDVNHGFLYRKDIFDKNNIKQWTNTEEFYQALRKLKEIYPDSTPYVSKTQDNIFRDWAYGWGMSVYDYPMYYDETSKLWKFAFVQPEFKEMITFMKKLHDEGLLDPEFLTDTQASWTAKMTQDDKAFVTFDWIGRLDMFTNQLKEQLPDYDLRYANPVGSVGKIRRLNKIDSWGIVVPKNANSEIALKLLDYLTSPSGATLITMGIEGEHFTFDANNKPVYPGLKDLEKVEITVLEKEYGCWLQGMYVRTDPRSAYYNYTEREQEAQDLMVKSERILELDPILKFTDTESASKAELTDPLLKAGLEFASRFVLNKSYGENEWNDWLKKAETLQYEKLEEIYQGAQKRYDSAN